MVFARNTKSEAAGKQVVGWAMGSSIHYNVKHHIWTTHHLMEERLKVNAGSSSWRHNAKFFYWEEDFTYKAGAVNFALAWFQQAMEVSAAIWRITDRLTDRLD